MFGGGCANIQLGVGNGGRAEPCERPLVRVIEFVRREGFAGAMQGREGSNHRYVAVIKDVEGYDKSKGIRLHTLIGRHRVTPVIKLLNDHSLEIDPVDKGKALVSFSSYVSDKDRQAVEQMHLLYKDADRLVQKKALCNLLKREGTNALIEDLLNRGNLGFTNKCRTLLTLVQQAGRESVIDLLRKDPDVELCYQEYLKKQATPKYDKQKGLALRNLIREHRIKPVLVLLRGDTTIDPLDKGKALVAFAAYARDERKYASEEMRLLCKNTELVHQEQALNHLLTRKDTNELIKVLLINGSLPIEFKGRLLLHLMQQPGREGVVCFLHKQEGMESFYREYARQIAIQKGARLVRSRSL